MGTDIRIGTSGYHYKHWVGTFYPAKTPPSKMLEYYVLHFDTLELNNSFYRLPTIEAFESWRDATPRNFVFAVKASRFITHNKKLKDPENALDNILPRAEHLGKKLGPVLFQLPPKWKVNLARLGEHTVAKTVCRHAVKANDPLAGPELENLVEDLRCCAMPYTCPHGRPTLIEMNFRELEKKFGRVQ